MHVTPVGAPASLGLLKALGDDTRYAIYQHLAGVGRSLTTAEIAEHMNLHTNTVRPHLERLREVGLVDVRVDARGEVGRPQHRYSVASPVPALGNAAPATGELAELVLTMARRLGASSGDAYDVGYDTGAARAAQFEQAPSALEALVADLAQHGFEPSVEEGADHETAVVAFGRCPFAAHVDEHPELICTLHRGIVSGLVGEMGDAKVVEFCDRSHRTPCRVTVGER